MEKILIVEDELIVARDIRKTLEKAGHTITGIARTAEKALSLIHENPPTLVLLDIMLKGEVTGIELAAQLNTEGYPFIYISANASQLILEAAKKTNPCGFVVKPFREKDLIVAVDIARYRYEHARQLPPAAGTGTTPAPTENRRTRRQQVCGNIVGSSSSMLRLYNLIEQVAPFNTTVLLLGESGTGKEGIAACIVSRSLRSQRPFIKVNCAAMPAGLLEAEFFGYEKGAFTGAYERKAGKFEQASGGTLLLDEIGEMPLEMQSKLLRVLQEGEVQRLGSSTPVKTDVRIIAATNKNLEKEVAEGRFRLDLYYRLHIFPVHIPALRERPEDIPLLIHHFVKHYTIQTGKAIELPGNAVMQPLLHYHWPGNVRELQALTERTVLTTTGTAIREFTLPAASKPALPVSAAAEEEEEKSRIRQMLELCNFKISGKGGAAELLNLTPAILYAKIKKYGFSKGYTAD